MIEMANDAMRIAAVLNGSYHEPPGVRALFSRLIGKPVPETLGLFSPFTGDYGKNISMGDNVFINSGCRFQDHRPSQLGMGR
jgi:acetyltransferase-like isoleucine patch superfamily enzyme